MRILVISNLYPPDCLGGYEMGCRQAAEALRDAGHDVLVLTTVPRGGPVSSEPSVLRRLRLIDIYDSFTERKTGAAAKAVHNQEACGVHAFNVQTVLEGVAEFQPDVAYVWNVIGLGGLGLLAALQHVGVPWVMHLMDRVPAVLCAGNLHGQSVASLATAFRRLCRGRFICCSQTTLDEIAAAGLDLTDRATLIPNWFAAEAMPRTVYQPDGALRIMYAGSLKSFKGVGIVVDAVALLRDRGYTNFTVDLYGFGEDHEFRSQIQKHQLGDVVHLKGPRTQAQLNRLYAQYDLFAFPTWAREPFAFAPLEAMAHGCVPILSSTCGNSEWFIHGLDCLKAERNPSAFAWILERVLSGAIPLAEIGQRAVRVVQRDFHIAAIRPKIEAELQAAVQAGGGPARPADEAYRMALLAEKTLACLLHETTAA